MATLSTLILRYSMVMVFASLTVVFMLATLYKSKLNTATLITKPSSILSHTRELTVEKNTKTDDVISLNASVNDLVQSLVKEKLDSEIVRLLLKRETKEATVQPPVTEDPELLIDRRVAQSMSSKVRVLCWIPSREMYWQTRLKAVNETWARRCDKTIYFMTSPKNKSHDVVGVTIRDSRQTLTDKTVYAHKYIYRHYLEDFDWFLKADDDTYVIMENLRFLLWHFNVDVPGYIGCQFKHFAPQGYMSGGAGYAFNRKGIKQLVENGYDIPGRCRLEGGAEDIETGRCAYKAGVRTLNQLDTHRRETFFPANVYGTALGPVPDWAIGYMRNGFTAGKKCCSQLLVSFHYTGTKLMYAIDFLLYGVSVYGRRFMDDKAWSLFDGKEAPDMELSQRRRPYPGETLDEYYQEGWREKNTTIYINPNL